MSLEHRLKSLERQVSQLQKAASGARSRVISDEEIIAHIQSGDFDSRYLDAAYKIIKFGILGNVLIGSRFIRKRWLTEMDRHHYWGGSPLSIAAWVIAAGDDIRPPSHLDVDFWAEHMTSPLGDERPRRREDRCGIAWRGQKGLAKRLLHEFGVQSLQDVVSRMTTRWDEEGHNIFLETVPPVDEAQWDRMVKIFRPFQSIWNETLKAPTPEGRCWI